MRAIEQRFKTNRPELTDVGGDGCLGDPAYQLLLTPPLGDESGDAHQGQIVLLGKTIQLGEAGHAAVCVDDLTQSPGRTHTRQAG